MTLVKLETVFSQESKDYHRILAGFWIPENEVKFHGIEKGDILWLFIRKIDGKKTDRFCANFLVAVTDIKSDQAYCPINPALFIYAEIMWNLKLDSFINIEVEEVIKHQRIKLLK